MVVYTKLTIDGTRYTDYFDIKLERSIGDYNATSSFTITFDNFAGKFSDIFKLNQEIIIYADKNINPPTTKIFAGVIENIEYQGSKLEEQIILTGRDYGAVLMDMTVQPVIFKNTDAGEIAKTIINQNSFGIVTTNNVDITTGTTIEKIGFNHKNIFDSLKQLAELAEYYFYIDENKDVHFEERAGTSSGETFDNTNILNVNFTSDDSEIFNKVWIYGDNILTGANETFVADGIGSIFTLTDNPYNTRASVAGSLVEKGGILNLNDPSTTSGLYWVIDFDEKDIVFVSGVAAGDNIPASGQNISIDYDRSTPILKFVQDIDSINTYGPKTKVIVDKNIKNYAEATDKANSYLSEHKDNKIEGSLDIHGILNITPGNTCEVNIPFHNINNQTYTILNATYNFNKENNLTESVLSVNVNKKIIDFVDTMKEQMNRIKTVETSQLEGNFTRLQTAVGQIDTQVHYDIYGLNINNNFVFHSNKHGRFNDPNSRIGTGNLGSQLLTSGGDF